MEFKSIMIKNFRTFEYIHVSLSNQNIFFGMNDVGKTNFMYALRFLFDRNIRIQNFLESDYHCRNTENPIEICIEIDLSDTDSVDTQKLISKLKGSLSSGQNRAYIRLVADYDPSELIGIPKLFWGGDLEKLDEIRESYYELDKIVNVIYINSFVDLSTFFKKHLSHFIKSDNVDDEGILKRIFELSSEINTNISTLSGVKKFEENINPKYEKLCNDNHPVTISLKSEFAIKKIYSDIIPYITSDGEDANLYPTSGDGRRKLLVYSMFELMAEEEAEKKINIFLVEEPENHLHKSLQIKLSQLLFQNDDYRYLFITTHSPFILYEMDSVNLIRIYNEGAINSASVLYTVPNEFNASKKMLNKSLSEAIFANKVLLVEGPSELALFEKILAYKFPFFESNGMYLLSVNGIGFKPYIPVFDGLRIPYIIKTDNDLRKSGNEFSVLGFIRCNSLIGKLLLPEDKISSNLHTDKIALYRSNRDVLDSIRQNHNVFLSQCDLETDLDDVLHDELSNYLETDSVVQYLQESKHYNMISLVGKLTDEDCDKIYNHYNFECLKKLVE